VARAVQMKLQFLGERGVVADLEGFHAMRVQSMGAPDAAHAGLADADRSRHGARAPMRGVGRRLPRGHGHDALRQTGADGGLATGPGRVLQQPERFRYSWGAWTSVNSPKSNSPWRGFQH
jgi:hypothetical protein